MFFRKRNKAKPDNDKLRYFIYRDSLTGCMNRQGALAEYAKVKQDESYGAVIVRLCGADEMEFYKAELYIGETGGLLARMTKDEVFRVEHGDFVIFTPNYSEEARKIRFFMKKLETDKRKYAVAGDGLDGNESFDLLYRRLRRRAEEDRVIGEWFNVKCQ